MAASESRLDFEVFLDDRPIGTHRFDIQRAADGTSSVSSVAVFDVRILGIKFYGYRHQAVERWAQGCLVQIEATTNDNGRQLQVSGRQNGGSFQLQQGAVRDDCVSSYAYWDPERLLLQRELLNPQTGMFDQVQFESLGEETLLRHGAAVRANRYRLRSGKLAIELWYSLSGEWLQLDSTDSSNRQLRYRLPESSGWNRSGRNRDDEQRAAFDRLHQRQLAAMSSRHLARQIQPKAGATGLPRARGV